MIIEIDDRITGKEKQEEIKGQLITYGVLKFGENKKKIAKFTGYSQRLVSKHIKEFGLLKEKTEIIDNKILTKEEIIENKRIMTWIYENIRLFSFMTPDQKEQIKRIVKFNFSDLFFKRKNLQDLL
jgi:hypothetical protein